MPTSIQFENVQGKQIFTVLTEPAVSQKQIVIMSHGFRGSSIGPARSFVDFETVLVQNGISSFRFDQPNSGNSEGDFIDSSFTSWLDTTAYFAQKYLDAGYKVALLGQSMGATASLVVAARPSLRAKIACVLLWVPDPKSSFSVEPSQMYEEAGQKYYGRFWQEAREADFLAALNTYSGGIHLVYGENDRYISPELRQTVIEKVAQKKQPYIVLPGQDHSPWDFAVTQNVFQEELQFLTRHFST